RRIASLALTALGIAAAVALIASGIVASGVLVPTRTVPNVTDGDLAAALTDLEAAGLKGEVVEEVHSDGTVAGQVLDQDPDPGTSLKANKPVELTVSLGPPPVAVPDLGGRTEAEALAMLEGAGLTVGERVTEYNDHPKGIVINWAPQGVEAPKGTPVNLVVSDGPPPVTMPELAGKSADEAVERLKELGLDPVREKVYSDTVAPGFVVRTSPRAGGEAPHGSKVTVYESLGPELVTVPDVEGKTVDQARAQLEGAGLRVGDIEGKQRRGRVEATDPDAGERVPKGTSVDLFVP
ncbi:MAG: PASTA domain-containing protein, partial [Actinobacteria bacterium]|nr:PASTA domain-containing protein [Actinomycetota bacterium]